MSTAAPTPVLERDALYHTDNGRIVCGQHAGASALYTGRDISGQRVVRVTERDATEWRKLVDSKICCEYCGRALGEGGLRTRTSLALFIAGLPAPLTRRGATASTLAVVAKRIRLELAAAVTAGLFPDGTKFSVTSGRGRSITVGVTAWHGAVFSEPYVETLMDPTVLWHPGERTTWSDARQQYEDPRIAEPLRAARWVADRIADRHNYDNSDIATDYFDVGYYLSVDTAPVERLAAHAIRMETDQNYAALYQRAVDAAAVIGPRATQAILRHGWDSATQWDLERLVKRGAAGKHLTYSRGRWVPL